MANAQTPGAYGASMTNDTGLDSGLGSGDSGSTTNLGAGSTGSTDQGTTGSGSGVGERAGAAASQAKGSAQRVAGTAKNEAGGIASEAKTQVKNLVGRVGGEVRDQAKHQQSRLAEGVRSLGSDLSRMAESSENGGIASKVAQTAGSRADSVANWLDTKDPATLVDDVRSFASRRPGVFLAIAAGAGLVVGRLARAAMGSGDQSNGNGRTGYDTTSGTGYDTTGTGYSGADAGYGVAGGVSGGLGTAGTTGVADTSGYGADATGLADTPGLGGTGLGTGETDSVYRDATVDDALAGDRLDDTPRHRVEDDDTLGGTR